MASFGPPPESNVLSYPGISGNRFNPVEAGKVWAECIQMEKNSGYVHRMLDTHGKLGLHSEWACDISRKDGLMPSYESLEEVDYMIGWKKNKFGARQQPDIRHLIPALAKGLKKRTRHKIIDDLELGGNICFGGFDDLDDDRPAPTARSQARSQRSVACSASAPSLAPARNPPPPQGARPPQRTAPPSRGGGSAIAALSQTAPASFGLPALKAKSALSMASRSSLRQDTSRRDRIASLVCSEVNSQCSNLLDKRRRQ